MNYVFYDFETSGINVNFDQPLQIAAVLLDEEFNEIDVIDERCKLKDGVIANPKALLVNRVKIDILRDAQSFYDMMDIVQDKFSKWSPATFIGYNSIWFDEEVLRNSLFQSLHDPYITNTNSNSRADLFKIVLGLAPLGLDILNLPIKGEKGRISFKLEDIAKANDIQSTIKDYTAHDALSDVRATIGVAKIIKEQASDYWNECMKTIKPKDMEDYLSTSKYFFAAPTHTSSKKYTPISYLTTNPNYLRELAFFDLENDPLRFSDSRVSAIIALIESKQKVIRLLKSNKSPVILSSEYIKNLDIYKKEDFLEFDKKANDLEKQESFVNNLKQALVDRLDDYQINQAVPEFLEDQLYAGEFFSSSDKEKMKIFKNTNSPNEQYKISQEFQDPRLREICYRFLFSISPNVLPDDKLLERKRFIADKVFCKEDKVKWCTLEKAKNELQAIKDDDKYIDQKDYIQEIDKYIKSEEEKYTSYLLGLV